MAFKMNGWSAFTKTPFKFGAMVGSHFGYNSPEQQRRRGSRALSSGQLGEIKDAKELARQRMLAEQQAVQQPKNRPDFQPWGGFGGLRGMLNRGRQGFGSFFGIQNPMGSAYTKKKIKKPTCIGKVRYNK